MPSLVAQSCGYKKTTSQVSPMERTLKWLWAAWLRSCVSVWSFHVGAASLCQGHIRLEMANLGSHRPRVTNQPVLLCLSHIEH